MMTTIQMEDISCPLGCERNDKIILSGCDLIYKLPGVFNIVKCAQCGLMRSNPRPNQDSIGFFYPEHYGPYIGTQVNQPKIKSFLKSMFKPFVNRYINDNSQKLPMMVPSRMLEIGCASGAFLNHMQSLGWKVEGIEFSAKAAQSARNLGHKVHIGSLESAPDLVNKVDLIVGWMVLEHLHNPNSCLKKLNEWSSPEGRLVLSVPNSDTLFFRLFKEQWFNIQLPTHLYHFTPKTLKDLLNQSGWELDSVHHHRSLLSLFTTLANIIEEKGGGWVRLAKLLRLLRWGKFFYILYPLSWTLGVLGQSGRMTVWASKRAM